MEFIERSVNVIYVILILTHSISYLKSMKKYTGLKMLVTMSYMFNILINAIMGTKKMIKIFYNRMVYKCMMYKCMMIHLYVYLKYNFSTVSSANHLL